MACEKCWRDAYVRAQTRGGFQADHYADLLRERAGNPCPPVEPEDDEPPKQAKPPPIRLRRHWQHRVDVREDGVRRAERVRGVCKV